MFIGDFFYEIPTSLESLNFTSIYYPLFVFIVFILARFNKAIIRPYIILLANIVFLFSFSLNDLYAILIIGIISYIFSYIIHKYHHKISLYLALSLLIILLIIFKYHHYFNFDNLIMPLGLSFYSFKIMAYLIDIYHKDIFEANILYYFDYIMFFPTIIAGPINRAENFFIWLKQRQEFDYNDAKSGGQQLLFGVFEKLVFVDYLNQIANLILNNNELYGLNVFLGIITYAFLIYLDFDALSNIAIGSARVVGLNLSKNFNSPYLSSNLKEFWHRWHISLSSWFKDYLYIPLGGSKKGRIRKYLNIVIVFVISGLWHGNAINFFIWGLLNGLIQIIEEIIMNKINKYNINKIIKTLLKIVGIIINFMIISILWLIFKYQNIDEVIMIINRLFINQTFNIDLITITTAQLYWLIFILVTTIILDILRNSFDMLKIINQRYLLPFRWLLYTLLIIIFLIFGVYGGSFAANDFIYRYF